MDMVKNVEDILRNRDRIIVSKRLVNKNMNCIITDNHDCVYFLKWDEQVWLKAGREVENIPWVGIAINRDVFMLFIKEFDSKPCKKLYFNWIEAAEHIYYIDADEFLHLAKGPHTQRFNGEIVLVIPLRSLKRL